MKHATRPKQGRPYPVPPKGYLTINEAANRAEASYSMVYRMVQRDELEHVSSDSVTFVLAADVPKIKRRLVSVGSTDEERKAVQLRPALDRYKRWARVAKDAGHDRVSTWVSELADAAVKASGR